MRTFMALVAVAAVAVAVVVAPTAGAAPTTATADKDIVATAVAAGQFKTLASLLTKAGLVKTLQGKGPFTVFAPTDAAFKAVPKATLNRLAADPALLKKVLLYHVVKGSVPASKVVKLSGKSVATVAGPKVKIDVMGSSVFVNKAKVIKADVMASNGIIHVISKVLIPS